MNDGVLYEELVLKLKAAAHAERTLNAAQVHLVNLTEIIERAGRYWPQVRERIRVGSADFLRGCVGADDIIIPCGTDFLIVFAEGAPEDLSRRSQEIQELLTAFYVGQEGLERLCADINPKDLSAEDLNDMLSPPATPTAEPEPGAASDALFMPIWSPSSQLIVGQFCIPTYCDNGIVRYGYGERFRATGGHNEGPFEDTDHTILDTTATAMAGMLTRNAIGALGASVHVSTLRRHKAALEYLKRLQAIPPAARERMVIKIAEIEHGTPSATLSTLVGLLRPHVRHVALEFHHSERALERIGDVGAWSIGCDLPAHANNPSEAGLRPLMETMRAWTRVARRLGIRAYVGGLRSPRLITIARDAGVDFIASEAFWPPSREPTDPGFAPAPVLK